MSKVGIIVDGPGDFSSLKKRFPKPKYTILKTDGPRGHCASIESIVSKSRKQISLLKKFKCSTIIVLLDFECREIKYTDFTQTLDQQFTAKYGKDTVTPCVANKMIENWYLADIAHLSRNFKFLNLVKKQKHYEGKHGKKELKKVMQKGKTYNEVNHGAQLFEKLRFEEARLYSPSFKDFLDNV